MNKILITDKILAATILKLIPRKVVPNYVTTLRFLLIPFVFYLLAYSQYRWGIIIFTLAALTDALDGALARTRDQITDWGKLFDPLADKLLVGVSAAILVTRFVSFYLALAIIAVELVIVVSAFLKRHQHQRVIQANVVGKVKMVLQSVGLFLILLHVFWPNPIILEAAGTLLYTSLVFAVGSIFLYGSI